MLLERLAAAEEQHQHPSAREQAAGRHHDEVSLACEQEGLPYATLARRGSIHMVPRVLIVGVSSW